MLVDCLREERETFQIVLRLVGRCLHWLGDCLGCERDISGDKSRHIEFKESFLSYWERNGAATGVQQLPLPAQCAARTAEIAKICAAATALGGLVEVRDGRTIITIRTTQAGTA